MSRCQKRVVRVSARLLVASFVAVIALLTVPAGPAGAADAGDAIRPVTERDHIRGDPRAPVKIVEYSDTECPVCKQLHGTLQRLLRQYPGKIAWVYRHRPIARIHPRALKEAEATECAAELGGPAAFWAFLDRLFEVTPSNNKLDAAALPAIAVHVGLDRKPFEQCLASGRHAARVAADTAEVEALGSYGAPFGIVVAPNGSTYRMPGAQSYETWEIVVEIALRERAP